MKRIAVVVASAVAGSVMLTGCGDIGGGKGVSKPSKGMVYERSESLDSVGNKVYELDLTTDRKAIRRKASRTSPSMQKEIEVSKEVYDSCSLTEMYPACK